MVKQFFIAIIFLSVLFGCDQNKALFLEVVQDHRVVTIETLTAVKKTIIDEANSSTLTEDQKKGIQDLTDRLDFIMNGSNTIEKYVNAKYVNQEVLAELLRSKWNKGVINAEKTKSK